MKVRDFVNKLIEAEYCIFVGIDTICFEIFYKYLKDKVKFVVDDLAVVGVVSGLKLAGVRSIAFFVDSDNFILTHKRFLNNYGIGVVGVTYNSFLNNVDELSKYNIHRMNLDESNLNTIVSLLTDVDFNKNSLLIVIKDEVFGD